LLPEPISSIADLALRKPDVFSLDRENGLSVEGVMRWVGRPDLPPGVQEVAVGFEFKLERLVGGKQFLGRQ
jgi:hypothetical protein